MKRQFWSSAGICLGLIFGGCQSPDASDDASGDAGVESGIMAGGESMETGGEMGGEMQAGTSAEPPEIFPRYAENMLALVNELRAEGVVCGTMQMPPVGPLTLNSLLNESSLLHAEDMAEQGYFEHESLDGRTPWDRMNDVGYHGSAYGENIAAGRAGAGATFDQWVNSPGHCTNMMDPDFTELGVGYFALNGSEYTHYWVQNFGRP